MDIPVLSVIFVTANDDSGTAENSAVILPDIWQRLAVLEALVAELTARVATLLPSA